MRGQLPNHFVKSRSFREEIGICKDTERAWLAQGRLPKKVRLSPRVSGYWRKDVEQWKRANGYAQKTA
ncbi:hypothetical protein [Methylocaldum sp.]|uniref:helix-turn-helix transcriptional regulator n=1 Tax=Methylocaldum sp. TaxID=1969727 RepID=UPI002D324E93|nr:hypothetical protein [Methylocaldum sp.]HYE35668.1 hypothetical protein [Methylocaldum sp.]